MGKALFISFGLLAMPAPAFAQPIANFPSIKTETPGEAAAVAASPETAPSSVMIMHDTPIELIATKEVSTATAVAGSHFTLSVNKAVVLDGRTVVPWGTRAYGEVTSASASGSLGVTGKMTARLLYLQLGDAQIKLQGDVTAKGQGAGSSGVAILLTGWVGLFHRGNNAKIKAGETVTAFVDEDVALDVSGPTVRRAVPDTAPPQIGAAKTADTL